MTITQLEYLVALHNQGNFVQAADQCNVTQPALTTQIKNLEEELGVLLFDRSRKPMVITEAGTAVVDQAYRVLQEVRRLRDIADSFQGSLKGTLRIGIIPTLAPYLLPLFIRQFQAKYPSIELVFVEDLSHNLLQKLKLGQVDACLIATPVQTKGTMAFPLFYERFFFYLHPHHKLLEKDYVNESDVKDEVFWILKEGNCFRNQVIAICELDQSNSLNSAFRYEGSSLDTLVRLVETQQGLTVLPELAIRNLPISKKPQIKAYKDEDVVREISLVVSRSYLKKPLLDQFMEEIVTYLPHHMTELNGHKVVNTYMRA
ncbi:MAG TPA: DNA-binding transcriptional regulator OxyR [Cytophagales bacterium]|nr:DNA-binding transcriptional regulator OxyR [Cytophagales bacterium]HAA21168.1 DNA-binding transcriptional regulator OxyR [Cytophagales bacterium]HAP60688.1 DNA-binding transcriptional regulator OxyR [Cytophagales bacterium]